MSSFISYYNSHRPEIDDGYYSDEGDSQELEESVLREQAVQDREQTNGDRPKHKRRTPNIQHEQAEAPEAVMEEVDDSADNQTFTIEQNYHGLTVRLRKTAQRYQKWKGRCKKYKKKMKEEKLRRKSRKRRMPDDFIEEVHATVPMDGFLRPYKL